MPDFFVSYNKADRAWAEWIAWQLESAQYTTVLQAWDFLPSENWVIRMNEAVRDSKRTIAVLSPEYLAAMYTQPEWAAAFAKDPTGAKGILLPIRVRECELNDLWAQIAYIDLVGKPESDARQEILRGVKKERMKPDIAPDFPPAAPPVASSPVFPGPVPEVHLPKPGPFAVIVTKLLIAVGVIAALLVGAVLLERRSRGVTTKPVASSLPEAVPVEGSWFTITGQCVVYASPDTTYAVLRERLNAARESIAIGMYDFTATHVRDLLLSALRRGVSVSLLINPSGPSGNAESQIIDELRQAGATVVESKRSIRNGLYHPKVIVIDTTWTLVQSANFTPTGVPLTTSGNRDTGIAVESRELATYFRRLLETDTEHARNAESDDGSRRPSEDETSYPAYTPVRRFEALRIKGDAMVPGQQAQPRSGLRVLPVLTPDNYLAVIPKVLAGARQSIEIHQQYMAITTSSTGIRQLLDAIKIAQNRNPELKVRIILRRPSRSQWPQTGDVLENEYGWKLGSHVRFVNPRSGLSSTNKLLIVDRKLALVGSANWSQAGVARSREVSLLVDSATVASYYAQIFQADWDAALTELPGEDITD